MEVYLSHDKKQKTNLNILDFVRIYNKWATVSADYLILKALRDLECGDEKKRSINQTVLAKEYEEKIQNHEDLLESYLLDLHYIAEELDRDCNIFELLEDIPKMSL